jgi:hypothetical protein
MLTVDEIIQRVRAVPAALTLDAWQELTVAVRAVLESTITAHTTPDGVPWAPRKRGHKPVLNNAVDALRVATVRGTIWIRLVGPEALHHRGRAKGKVKREIILTHITEPVALAIHRVLSAKFDAVMKGNAT